ncbi:MAG: peptidoglycan binding domain-containing protein, partial [Clostridia bacterium]|nr:peptidoglycan binding domain-containing protein [Clostridia bacterium]
MKDFFAKIKTLFKKSKGIVTASLLCTAAVVLIVCFFAYSAAYARILPNIKVEGLSVAGMTTEEAAKEIESSFGKIADGREITVVCEEKEKKVSFSELEAEVDSKKTAEKAFGFGRDNGNFKKAIKMFCLAFKGEDVQLEVSMNEKKLEEIIKELAGEKELPATGTTYQIEGDKLTIIKGHGGRMVDRKKAAEAISAAVANLGTKKLDFIIETLEAEPVDVEEFYKELTAPAKNAAYRFENGEVVIDDEKVGIIVDKKLIAEALGSPQE